MSEITRRAFLVLMLAATPAAASDVIFRNGFEKLEPCKLDVSDIDDCLLGAP